MLVSYLYPQESVGSIMSSKNMHQKKAFKRKTSPFVKQNLANGIFNFVFE